MPISELNHAVRAALVVKRDRLIRLQETLRIAGIGKSSVYTMMAAGHFPRCVQITPRCVAWSEQAVLQWVQDRLNDANPLGLASGSSVAAPESAGARHA